MSTMLAPPTPVAAPSRPPRFAALRKGLVKLTVAAACAVPVAVGGAVLSPTAYAAPSEKTNMFHPDCRAQYALQSPYLTDGCVTRLQRVLKGKGYNIVVDGVFGPATEAAVKKWKVTVGLSNSGLVGPATMTQLEKATGVKRDLVLAFGLRANRQHAMGNSTIGQWNGGKIRYSHDGGTSNPTMGGGHGARPGPSKLDANRTPDPNNGYLDCSGFSRWASSLAYAERNLPNPHANWSTLGIRQNVPSISLSNLRPGDLIVWRNRANTAGHVAIWMGNNQIVHSVNGAQNGVGVSSRSGVDGWYSGGTITYHRLP